jgi:hypothetical protein
MDSQHQIITIRAAEAAGLKHYFTGKPCSKGHRDLRYVATRRCVRCTRDHVLKWQKDNPSKRRVICKRYDDKRSKEEKLQESRRDHKTARLVRETRLAEIAGRPRPFVCELCGDPNSRRGDVIAFDHCHKHDHFRGWLCDRCNVTIGAAEDKPELLRKMADYLDRHANPDPSVIRLNDRDKKMLRVLRTG